MEPNLQVDIKKVAVNDKNVHIIDLSGEIDSVTLEIFEKKIAAGIDSHSDINLIFDISKLNYINSKFVGYLLNWYMELSEKEGLVVIVGARDHILDVLQVQGVLNFIPNTLTIEEAKLKFM